ncbi:hypothetical protein [Azospirillum sp. sgz302134]
MLRTMTVATLTVLAFAAPAQAQKQDYPGWVFDEMVPTGPYMRNMEQAQPVPGARPSHWGAMGRDGQGRTGGLPQRGADSARRAPSDPTLAPTLEGGLHPPTLDGGLRPPSLDNSRPASADGNRRMSSYSRTHSLNPPARDGRAPANTNTGRDLATTPPREVTINPSMNIEYGKSFND